MHPRVCTHERTRAEEREEDRERESLSHSLARALLQLYVILDCAEEMTFVSMSTPSLLLVYVCTCMYVYVCEH